MIPRSPNAQPIDYQSYEVQDFSGGLTDYFLDCPSNKFEEGDNLLILKHGNIGHLISRPGSVIYDATDSQIPAGAQRIGTLINFNSQLFFHSARKLYYISYGWQTLQGPSGNDLFPAGVDTTTQVSYSTWQNHLLVANHDFSRPQKIYKDNTNTWRLRTAGLPAIADTITITPAVGANNYLYAFLLKYDYMVGTLSFKDRGAVTIKSASNAVAPDITPIAISTIPVLANGATHNYDTANIKVEIYRTENNGTTFYYVGEVTNGTTTYNDNSSDATIAANEVLYTEGGVVENDEPPLCRVVHIVEDKAYYAHTKSGTEVNASRCFQSIPGDIDSVPATFFVDVDDNIVGISSVRGTPVLLCEKSAYRIDGSYDLLGRGGMIVQKISDRCSCVSSQSVVQTLEGVYWAGDDGFYYTDGYQVTRISDSIDKRYKNIVTTAERKRRIVGRFDPKQRRIWWSAQFDASATEVDTLFVLDINWGIKPDMPFTTVSGGSNFKPTAIEFDSGDLLRADARGYTFRHNEDYLTDPTIDTGSAASTWGTSAIIWDYISQATSFGTTFARKHVPRIGVVCQSETDLALQLISINDLGRKTANLSPIRFTGNMVWGDANEYWGDPTSLWNYTGIIDEWRRIPAQSLRCQFKQLQITNALVAIVSSDLIGMVNIDASANTATLSSSGSYDLPSDMNGYYISFQADGYTNNYEITAFTSDVMTFSDPSGLVQSANNQGWVLRGKPKGQAMELIGYTLHFAVLGKTNLGFRNNTTGEVGAAE